MQPIRPQDRITVAILTIALLAVLVYLVAFGIPQMLAARRVASSPAQSQTGAGTNPSPSFAQPLASAEETLDPLQRQALAQLDPDYPGPPATGRDPFKPPAGVPLPQQLVVSNTPPRTNTRPAPPPIRVINSGGLVPQGPGALGPAAVAPPPAPNFEVKGVIPGEPALAIVSVDGQMTYRQVGETLAQGWVIARISEVGVVLRNGRRSLTIEVGHSAKPEAGGSATPSSPRSQALDARPKAAANPPVTPANTTPAEPPPARLPISERPAPRSEPAQTAEQPAPETVVSQSAPRRRVRVTRRRARTAAAPRYVFTGRRL